MFDLRSLKNQQSLAEKSMANWRNLPQQQQQKPVCVAWKKRNGHAQISPSLIHHGWDHVPIDGEFKNHPSPRADLCSLQGI